MPDTGFNSYLSVAPDGTVVVPNNIDINGVISAGDFVTHPELDTAISDSIDAILEPTAGDVVALIARNAVTSGYEAKGSYAIAGEYAVDFDQATGAGATFFVDHDFGAGGPPGVWPVWTIAGEPHFTAGRAVLIDYFLVSGNTVRFTFYSLLAGLGQITGTFYFHVIGTEP
jgi:hypothetical protein